MAYEAGKIAHEPLQVGHDAGHAETMKEAKVTYTLEIDDQFIIVENVPARACEETGEHFFSPETVERLQQTVWGHERPKRMIETPVMNSNYRGNSKLLDGTITGGGELTHSYSVESGGEVRMTKQEIIEMIHRAGFEAVEKDTVYNRAEKTVF